MFLRAYLVEFRAFIVILSKRPCLFGGVLKCGICNLRCGFALTHPYYEPDKRWGMTK